MTRYLEILSTNRPIDIGRDENDRQMFSINFEATAAAPVGDWEREVHEILVTAGLASASDTRIGRDTTAPTGSGPYLHIVDTGGISPDETHNDNEYERLSCQIVVRASSYDVADARAQAIWRELHGTRGDTVTI